MEDIQIIEKIVQKWSVPVLKDVVGVLNDSNKYASGKLINELRWDLKNDLNTVYLSLVGPDYFHFVLNGRRAGKQPPLSKILEWTKLRGLPDKAAFPIARNIGRFGIKPFREPIGIIYKNLDGLKEVLTRDYAEKLKKETVEILINIKQK